MVDQWFTTSQDEPVFEPILESWGLSVGSWQVLSLSAWVSSGCSGVRKGQRHPGQPDIHFIFSKELVVKDTKPYHNILLTLVM